MDASGANVPSSLSLPSVAAMSYLSGDGYEELHLFFSVAWFDIGSWAWGHFFVEWGTKGVFQVWFLFLTTVVLFSAVVV